MEAEFSLIFQNETIVINHESISIFNSIVGIKHNACHYAESMEL